MWQWFTIGGLPIPDQRGTVDGVTEHALSLVNVDTPVKTRRFFAAQILEATILDIDEFQMLEEVLFHVPTAVRGFKPPLLWREVVNDLQCF